MVKCEGLWVQTYDTGSLQKMAAQMTCNDLADITDPFTFLTNLSKKNISGLYSSMQ